MGSLVRSWGAPLVAAAALVLLAGCGGGDGEEAATSIETVATEYQFDPDAWTVPAATEFSVDLSNEGTLEHEWAVLRAGEDIESEGEFSEDKVLFEIEAIPAGDSTSEQFTVDEAGTYQVICAIAGHFDAGMEGSLTVE